MAYSDSGESFFANSNFEFVDDDASSSRNSDNRPEANSLSITLWNKEVKLGETIDGLIKLGVSDHLPEGLIYLYYTVRERSKYTVANPKKVSRKFNLGVVSGLINAPKNLIGKDDRTTNDDVRSSKKSVLDTEKADSDEKAMLWGDNEREKMANNDDDLNNNIEYSNDDLKRDSSNHVDKLRNNQIKPLGDPLRSEITKGMYKKNVKPDTYPVEAIENNSLNKKNLEESILQAINYNSNLKSSNRTMQLSQNTQGSIDGSTVFYEKLIKVFTLHNPVNKSSLLFVPFRINLRESEDLLCSAEVHFELSDSTDSVRMSGIHDYFQLSIVHNIKFVYVPAESIKKYNGQRSLALDSKNGEIDLDTFKRLMSNSETDSNTIFDETDYKVIPNMDDQNKNLFMQKVHLRTKVIRFICLSVLKSFKLSISIDRTIINDQTEHLNVAFKYPRNMVGTFNYLEIILLMKFSSKSKPDMQKELIMLCEHVDIRNRFIGKNKKYLEFVHKFSLENLRSMNFHSVEVI